jgi:hypothetical protein
MGTSKFIISSTAFDPKSLNEILPLGSQGLQIGGTSQYRPKKPGMSPRSHSKVSFGCIADGISLLLFSACLGRQGV